MEIKAKLKSRSLVKMDKPLDDTLSMGTFQRTFLGEMSPKTPLNKLALI